MHTLEWVLCDFKPWFNPFYTLKNKDVSGCIFSLNVKCEWAEDLQVTSHFEPRFSVCCPWIIVNEPQTVRGTFAARICIHPFTIQWFARSHFVMCSWKESCSTPGRSRSTRRCRFAHVVAVHAEKKIIPSSDLENVDQPWPSVVRNMAVCELYFESLKKTSNNFMSTWISWHKRLISLKCMNCDHIILQTTNKNIFSSIPLGVVIITLKLNTKGFSPPIFFFFNSPTYYLEVFAANRLSVREILFMRVTERHLWASH